MPLTFAMTNSVTHTHLWYVINKNCLNGFFSSDFIECVVALRFNVMIQCQSGRHEWEFQRQFIFFLFSDWQIKATYKSQATDNNKKKIKKHIFTMAFRMRWKQEATYNFMFNRRCLRIFTHANALNTKLQTREKLNKRQTRFWHLLTTTSTHVGEEKEKKTRGEINCA